MDFLFSGQPSIWKGDLPSEWDCEQLQLIADRFSHSFDYEHFSQFPCALEFLTREKFVNIRADNNQYPSAQQSQQIEEGLMDDFLL